MEYPITLECDDNNTILVSFPDFPEAHTFGKDQVEALRRATDALATIIDAYIKDRRDIPVPSEAATRHRVTMSALIEAKVRLYEAMRAAKVGKAELARRLHWHMPQVDRLLAMTHGSRLEQIETAFGALGRRLVISVQNVAVPSGTQTAKRRPVLRSRLPRALRVGPKRRRTSQ